VDPTPAGPRVKRTTRRSKSVSNLAQGEQEEQEPPLK
jgi:hypothetical protein